METRRARSVEHGFVLAAALAAPLLLVGFGLWLAPDARGYGTHEKLGLPPCVMMEWFHLPCPGCGVTTSVALAAHGRILDAARNQPFGLFVALAIPAAAIWALVGHFRGRDLYRDLVSIRLGAWAWWLAGGIAAAWAYKIAVVLSSAPVKPPT
jgi:hypothetical protein